MCRGLAYLPPQPNNPTEGQIAMRYRTGFKTIEAAQEYLAEQRFRTTTLLARNASYNVHTSTGAILARVTGGWEVTYYDLYDVDQANRFRLAADRDAA